MKAIAIAIVAALTLIFIGTFVLYKKTPAPKGSEPLRPNALDCEKCESKGCEIYKERHKEDA